MADRADVTLACIQFEPIIGEPDHNLARMEAHIREAHARGADLVVLPELADSGYVFETMEETARLARPIPGGASAARLCALAAELGLHIVSGLAEEAGGDFYNSALLCGPDGPIGTYRKLHLWNRENLFFKPGNLGLPVFDTPLGRIGMAICYDGWFPETFRALAAAGAEIVCIPTNWVPMPEQDPEAEAMANVLHKAAAHSNGFYIACADRVGTERGQPFIGQSLILDATGWPLAGPASRSAPEILIATVTPGALRAKRQLNEFNNILGDRRTDVYG
ncbi:hydratase [Defluviimonas sp. 20V17]|uniref:Hydratase n=1 Tax=Allgaiera indica TaxID=765699 RepID=A0AAN5A129_9RHOB|nr:nitrilase family protein [Allgaiera indica]KDB05019.1 hydratase [Defluviimonas sp. 20V17]GHE05524.1 hydratase [Allgaiera indica]SDX69946.1 Predicted amidohydrolase [Allgaiera indica]